MTYVRPKAEVIGLGNEHFMTYSADSNWWEIFTGLFNSDGDVPQDVIDEYLGYNCTGFNGVGNNGKFTCSAFDPGDFNVDEHGFSFRRKGNSSNYTCEDY